MANQQPTIEPHWLQVATDEDIAQHKAVDSSSPVKSAAAIS